MNLIKTPEFKEAYTKKLQEIQNDCLKMEQVDLPILHDFSPGLYVRRIFMPKGTFVIGRTHKTEHLNIAMSGAANVMMNGEITFIKAPTVIKSDAGVRKVFYILEDMIWATTHATEETDLVKLEEELVLTLKEDGLVIDEETKKQLTQEVL